MYDIIHTEVMIVNKPDMERYTFWIPMDLRRELERRARADGRTLANYIVWLLRKAVTDESV